MLLETAKKYLEEFYSRTTGDEVTLPEIYTVSGRDLSDKEKNRKWLNNKLVYIKRLGLIEPIYKNYALEKIRLTLEGKKLLGRLQNPPKNNGSYNQNSRAISIEDIMKEIPRLRKENEGFNISFSVTPKDQ